MYKNNNILHRINVDILLVVLYCRILLSNSYTIFYYILYYILYIFYYIINLNFPLISILQIHVLLMVWTLFQLVRFQQTTSKMEKNPHEAPSKFF
jgi:hypothetical protein